MHRDAFLALILLVVAVEAGAESITAICKNPAGRAIGIENSAAINEPDGMLGGQISIKWTMGEKTAQIASQGPGVSTPVTEVAVTVHFSDEQASFVVVNPSTVWLYSLFVKPRHLVITRHTNSFANPKGGAIGSVLHAACDIQAKK
jgi:hypothetical protein